MAYKQDINLFKAAGGERAKSKQIPLIKKVTLVAVVIVVLVLAAVGGLYYYSSTVAKTLDAKKKLAKSYTDTSNRTRAESAVYLQLQSQLQAADALEYVNLIKPGYFSNLSQTELNAIQAYIESESNPYSVTNNFAEMAEEVLAQIDLSLYSETLGAEDVTEASYNLNFLYGALHYMNELSPVFEDLPLQNRDIWYCYYRGKAVFFLKGNAAEANEASAEELVAGLQDQAALGLPHSPFSTIYPSTLSQLEGRGSRYCLINMSDTDSYLVIALDCKSYVERLTEIIDDRFQLQMDEVSNPGTYTLSEVKFLKDESSLSISFTMDQTKLFSIQKVCDAINTSEFFHAEDSMVYSISSDEGSTTAQLKFTVLNEAVEAMSEQATIFFRIKEA